MTPDLNEGQRADLLTLGRRHAGELPGAVPDAYADAVSRSAAALPPLDVGALRARADTLDPREGPRAQSGRRWAWLAVPAALAAAALLFVAPTTPDVRTKGGPPAAACSGCAPGTLDGWVQQGGAAAAPIGPGTVVRAGDAVRFAVPAAGWHSVVLLNVDGTGRQTRFWPADAAAGPVPLDQAGPTLLEGSVTLDAAPGPEVFIAVFDAPDVPAAEARVAAAWGAGGLAGLRAAAAADDLAVVVLDKATGVP
jgi:hypothetical protein